MNFHTPYTSDPSDRQSNESSSCKHEEQDHRICLDCGMDCDPNSDFYGQVFDPPTHAAL